MTLDTAAKLTQLEAEMRALQAEMEVIKTVLYEQEQRIAALEARCAVADDYEIVFIPDSYTSVESA